MLTTEVIVEDGVVNVEVPAWGHVGLSVHDVGPFTVRLRDRHPTTVAGRRTYSFDDETAVGAVRGILLARPDGSGHDAYIQSTCPTPATLHYCLDHAAASGQWTPKASTPRSGRSSSLPVSPFRYRLTHGDETTHEMVLEA